ncbi:MAG: hypothetical protein ACKOCN_00040 [Planctomycetaceae bacterium]
MHPREIACDDGEYIREMINLRAAVMGSTLGGSGENESTREVSQSTPASQESRRLPIGGL